MGLFYSVARGLLDWGLRAFFSEIEVHGREHVPPGGPCLILANHHNGLIDPFLLMAAAPRPVSFVAKATLFNIPFLGWALRGLRCIPAYRVQDQGYSSGKNRGLFEASGAAMDEGRALGIFPEGQSHLDPKLLNFKHGASRIAFDAASRGLPVRILLAGIHFERTRGFRGKALVQFGPALAMEGRHTTDARAGVVELTEELHAKLQEMVLTADSRELVRLADLVEHMGVIEAAGEDGLKPAFDRKKALLDGYARLREQVPDQVEAFRGDLLEYQRFLDALGVRDDQVAEDYRAGRVFSYAIRNTLILGLGLPLMAAGIAGNFVPYLLAWAFSRPGGSLDNRTSIAFLVGTVAFPAWWLAVGFLAWKALGPWAGAAILAAAPLTGALALRWMDRWHQVLRDTWGLWRAVTLPGARSKLRRMRERILRRLQRLLSLWRSSC